MAAYTVTTIKTGSSPIKAPDFAEPFQVVVQDECDLQVARLGAMSQDHARMVAGALVLLLPKLDPGHSVVLDASINGHGTSHFFA